VSLDYQQNKTGADDILDASSGDRFVKGGCEEKMLETKLGRRTMGRFGCAAWTTQAATCPTPLLKYHMIQQLSV